MSKKETKFAASKEFLVGNHNIGYIYDSFTERFGKEKFSVRKLGTYQTLSKYMTDAQIESELKPGICELGDVLAFLDNAPTESKDGNWNLFYTKSFVVFVRWHADSGEWRVGAWLRDDCEWVQGNRVFSPATDHSESLGSSVTLTLESAIEMVKEAGYQVAKII